MPRLEESVWFEIFRTGIWHGFEYKKDDLDKMVENFAKGDPKVPLIIGHNSWWGDQEEKPAHGWVKELKRSGNRLMAKARNVSEELVEAVNEEIYPMRSVELWHNYRERGMTLSAIAFLGGSTPEVGGMADFQFASSGGGPGSFMRESDDGERICFAVKNMTHLEEAKPLQNNKPEHHQQGGDEMTEQEIKALIEGATNKVREDFSAEVANLKTENERLTRELGEATQHAAAVSVQAATEKCVQFAAKLLEDKKITPAQHNAGIGCFLLSLDDSESLEFSEGKKQTRRAFAMEFLDSLSGKKSLFTTIAENTPSDAGETAELPAGIEAFAKKHGMDAKVLAEQYRKQLGRPGDSE